MSTMGRGLFVVGVACIASLWGGAAQAAQVVVMDETWVHAPDIADSHFRVSPKDGTPGNWVDPVNYAGGSAWVYLEVHSKPTLQETRFQVCFEATPTYACTDQSPAYTTVGTYEWETPFQNFYQGNQVDWSKGTNKLAAILKDTMNNKPSADNVGEEMAALYMPTEVRLVVTLVETGSVYVPPTPTPEETGTGGEEGTGGGEGSTAGGEEAGSTAGGEETGAPDTTTTSTSTGDPGDTGTAGGTASPVTTGMTTGDPTPDSTGADSTTGSTGATGGSDSGTSESDPDDKSGGCGCVAPADQNGRGTLLLAGLLLALGRRRRG